ncbi:MAG: 4Fe-4S binding protein [Candidatus Aminicenantes bacterium]|nr:MAG: 4Fe-4S binding protein [Candidatus Aminicenantes bacterium]
MGRIKIHTKCEGAWSNAKDLLLCLNTKTWRTERPVINEEKFSYCGLCALYCPPQCMIDMKNLFLPNLEFCKGCGICAKECPQQAISILPEGGFQDEKEE